MDTTLSRPPAGQLLDGRYRVEAWLARGGMATVYLGTDTRLDRSVALKIAHPELAGDEEFIRRFIGEARSVARLSSPYVVAVYDQGTDGPFLYLAMEYVPGRTLRDLLRERGRLSPREALDLIEGVLAGLAAAHEAGIVHRDVKPENVLLGAGNVVKVADFGLARAAAAASRTKSGMIIGTAAYLAPEQVARSSSDSRTDVYAAGVMLFELLTGAQPHTGGSPLDVAYKHVNDVVPAPSSLVPGLPPALDALVALATSRDPGLRPADAAQFLRAISDVRRGLPIGGLRQSGQHQPGQHQPGQHSPGQYPVPPGSVPQAAGPAQDEAAARFLADPLGNTPLPPEFAAPGFGAPGAGPAGFAAAGFSAAGFSAPGFGAGPAADPLSGPPQAPPGGSLPPGFPAAALPGTAPPGTAPPGATDLLPAGPVPGSLPPGHPSGPRPGPPGGPHSGPGGPLPGGPGAPGQTLAIPGQGEPAVPPWSADFVPPARVAPGAAAGTNHTLIVTPGSLIPGSPPEDGQYRRRRAGAGRGRGEPLLQRLLFSRRLVYLGGAVAVVLVIVLLVWWLTSGQYATVPKVSGMPASVARTELTNLGFVVKNGPGRHSNLPKGEIVGTRPAIGTRASQGSTVVVITSLGPVRIAVPQVTGLPLDQAQAALQKVGLTPGQVTSASSQTIAAGIVISTDPVAGTSWPQPKPVGITVSAGPPLPNFVGQPLTTAQAAAQQGGYALNPVQDAKSDQPAGIVTSQSPAPGTPITPNEVVTIHVSAGPQQVSIPDVTGMTVQQAAKELKNAGFNVTVNQVMPGHRVINYSPTGQAPQGSTITLNVGFVFEMP
ncbi:MAG TPA: PASTA domain-containing protein [Streptosporangiaceae bacterium]|jgi:serine/threonine-protein kinase